MYPEQLTVGMEISFFCIPYDKIMYGKVNFTSRSYIDVGGIHYLPSEIKDIKVIK